MARKLRVQYPGAVYHVMNRGDRREAIFHDERDRRVFLATLQEACQKSGWQVHAFCLMANHFHFVMETPQANLVAGMKWFLGAYTGRFNRRHKEFGHLFSGRYKALVVDGSGSGYLKTACDYVHLNPDRANLLAPEQKLQEYGWSSYPLYLKAPGQRPAWLRTDRLLGEWKVPKDSPAGRADFAQGMERRRLEDLAREFKPVERGWCLGGEQFRRELLEQVAVGPGPSHFGQAVQEAVVVTAEKIVAQELKRKGWTDADLSSRRKGDTGKVELAVAVRSRSTVPLSWIAERLRMGSRGYLTWLLQRQPKPNPGQPEFRLS
jgi:putative transposase